MVVLALYVGVALLLGGLLLLVLALAVPDRRRRLLGGGLGLVALGAAELAAAAARFGG